MPYFVDMKTGQRVHCQAAGGVCERHEARLAYLDAVESVLGISHLLQGYLNRSTNSLPEHLYKEGYTPDCNSLGEYNPTQCDDAGNCWCVRYDGTPSKYGHPHHCDLTKVDKLVMLLGLQTVKMKVDVSDIAEQVAVMMFVDVETVTVVKKMENSVIRNKRAARKEDETLVEVTVNLAGDARAASKVALMKDAVADGTLVFIINGQEVLAKKYSATVVSSDPPTTPVEPCEESVTKVTMDETTKWVLIGVAAFVGFCLLIITIAVVCRSCKGNTSAKYSPPASENSSIKNLKMSFDGPCNEQRYV